MATGKKFTYEVIERIGVLSVSSTGWSKEVNLISWNNADAKIDIREWDESHEHMSKGITLRVDEAQTLNNLLSDYFGGEF